MINSLYQKLWLCFKTCAMTTLVFLLFTSSVLAQNYSATWTQGQRLVPDYTGTLNLTNGTTTAVENYYVEFELDPYYSQVSTNSGTVTSIGNNQYRWEPPSWGSTSMGAGSSVGISIIAKYAGISIPPFNATIHGSNITTAAFNVKNLSPLFASPCGQPECAPATGYDPSQKIIAYYISWGVYGRNFHVQNIRADKVTHINFAFANINPTTHKVVVGDEYADLQKEGGSFDKLYQLKQYYPHLKTIISVGGWTWSTNFYEAAATAANRQAFAQSVREFVTKYKFDGVDLDWEYPGGGGNDAGKGSPEDGANYTKLVQAIRAELDAQEAIDGKHYLITAALGAGTSKINAMDVPGFFSVVDWANIMTYDMNGAWANYTGHHAPLFNSAGDGVGQYPDGSPIIDPAFNVNSAITHYINDGAPAGKITVGLPIYSREWRDVAEGDSHGLYQPSTATQPPPGSWDEPGQPSGVHDYKDLVASYINKNGYTRYWDDVAKAPYLFNPNQLGGHFISYEDIESLGHKISYIHQNNLAGAMYWEATEDVTGANSLIDKIYTGIMAGGCGSNCPNTPPTVSLTAPTNGGSFTEGTTINISASATDGDGSIAKVEFFSGTNKLGEDLTSPYSFSWQGAAIGSYELTAVATDNDNASATSAKVTITVNAQGTNDPPVVTLTAPADGDSFSEGTTITLSAAASDTDGSIAKVEFFQGTNKLGEVTTAPYDLAWSGALAGSYSLSAKATDNEGATTNSSSVNITVTPSTGGGCDGIPQYVAGTSYSQAQQVQNQGNKYECSVAGWCSSSAAWAYEPGVGMYWQDAWSLVGPCGNDTGTNQPPIVSISAPANGASFNEGSDITFSASATDDGSVVKVEYFNGTTKIGEASSGTYNVTWSAVPAGGYTVTAVATDNQGTSATSAAISITVNSTSTGGGCDGIPVWSATQVYYGGDQVQYNGNKYQANYWTQNNNPEQYSDPYEQWSNLGPCNGSTGARTATNLQEQPPQGSLRFTLEQNYPNPFTEYTIIGFSLPDRLPVKLVVYNATGKEVLRVIDEQLQPGKHQFTLNTTKLPKGIYHYQLSYGAQVKTLKMFKP